MSSRITEVLSDRRSCKRCIVLQGSRVGSGSRHDDGIVHRPLFLQSIYDRCDCRAFLTDGHIDTVHRFAPEISFTLVDDGIYRYCSLSCLAVSDDKFSLASTYRNHGVYGLQTCLERLGHRLTEDDSRSLAFKRHLDKFAGDGTPAVKRFAERIHDASHHGLAHLDRSDASCPVHGHALLDLICRSKKHSTHIVFFKVHDHSHHTVVKLKKFSGFRIQQAMDAHHAVADLQHLADLLILKVVADCLELVKQYL